MSGHCEGCGNAICVCDQAARDARAPPCCHGVVVGTCSFCAEVVVLRLRAEKAEEDRDRYAALAFEYDGFSGPCMHGRDPWDRCDECESGTAFQAAAKAAVHFAARARLMESLAAAKDGSLEMAGRRCAELLARAEAAEARVAELEAAIKDAEHRLAVAALDNDDAQAVRESLAAVVRAPLLDSPPAESESLSPDEIEALVNAGRLPWLEDHDARVRKGAEVSALLAAGEMLRGKADETSGHECETLHWAAGACDRLARRAHDAPLAPALPEIKPGDWLADVPEWPGDETEEELIDAVLDGKDAKP